MRNRLIIWSALIFFFSGTGLFAQESAVSILTKMDEKIRGKSSYSEMKMTIQRPDWSREMTMKSWTKGTDRSLILLTAPARDAGTAFLMRAKEIWNWQPSIDRVIKLPPSMMLQSWMGSDFTNDDLVKQSSLIDDYDSKIIGEEIIEGYKCHKLELIPNEDAAVVWGKLYMWVTQKDYMQMRVEFYDEDGYLVNTMMGKNVTDFGDVTIPALLEVVPEDESGNKTIIEYLKLDLDINVKDSFFSLQNLKRVK